MLENPEGHPAVPAPGSFFLYEIDIIALNVYNYARCGSIRYSKTAMAGGDPQNGD